MQLYYCYSIVTRCASNPKALYEIMTPKHPSRLERYKLRSPKCLLLHHYKLGEPSSKLTLVKTQNTILNKTIGRPKIAKQEKDRGPKRYEGATTNLRPPTGNVKTTTPDFRTTGSEGFCDFKGRDSVASIPRVKQQASHKRS